MPLVRHILLVACLMLCDFVISHDGNQNFGCMWTHGGSTNGEGGTITTSSPCDNRGPKGDLGQPGKAGPQGIQGAIGPQGIPGVCDKNETEALSEKLITVEREVNCGKNKTEALSEKLTTVEREVNSGKNETEALSEKLTSVEREVNSGKNDMEALSEKLTTVEREVNSGKNKTEALSEKLTTVEREITSGKNDTEALSEKLTTVEREVNSGKNKTKALSEKLTTVEREVNSGKDDTEALSEKLTTVEREVNSGKNKTEALSEKLTTVEREVNSGKNDTEALSEKLTTVEREVNKFDELARNDGASGPSCKALLTAGYSQSGIYLIKPDVFSSSFPVFCEMETAGGGWTLVASVHENNIHGKCSTGDRWSADQSYRASDAKYLGTGSWENMRMFGKVESATSDDYKNQAYFNLDASDVMIWHVPNDVSVARWSNQAFLKYYTSNGFLAQYGGTLQSLYKNHFPLTRSSHDPSYLGSENLADMMQELNSKASQMRSAVPNFYSYTYDNSGVHTQITDGGGDMYDGGNMVYYQIGTGGYQRITYGQTYSTPAHQVQVMSLRIHPFIMLMRVGNDDRSVDYFDIKVYTASGADGGGSYTTYTGSRSYGNFYLQYKSYNVYGTSDPSICEVHFYMYNPVLWKSIRPSTYASVQWGSSTDPFTNIMRASGRPKSIVMGYVLLSRTSGSQVSSSYVNSVLDLILRAVATVEWPCDAIESSLVVPVNYARGSDAEIMRRIPPKARPSVTAGYVQFRAYSKEGIPNAFCPGVRSKACRQSSVCIGGVNTYNDDQTACGDFAGWNGLSGDSPSQSQPSGNARSLDDINSSILFFTRN